MFIIVLRSTLLMFIIRNHTVSRSNYLVLVIIFPLPLTDITFRNDFHWRSRSFMPLLCATRFITFVLGLHGGNHAIATLSCVVRNPVYLCSALQFVEGRGRIIGRKGFDIPIRYGNWTSKSASRELSINTKLSLIMYASLEPKPVVPYPMFSHIIDLAVHV